MDGYVVVAGGTSVIKVKTFGNIVSGSNPV